MLIKRYLPPPQTPALREAVRQLYAAYPPFDALATLLTILSQQPGYSYEWRTSLSLEKFLENDSLDTTEPIPALDNICLAHWEAFCRHVDTLPLSPAIAAIIIGTLDRSPHPPSIIPAHLTEALKFHSDLSTQYGILHFSAILIETIPKEHIATLIKTKAIKSFIDFYRLNEDEALAWLTHPGATDQIDPLFRLIASRIDKSVTTYGNRMTWTSFCTRISTHPTWALVKPIIHQLPASYRLVFLFIPGASVNDLLASLRALGSLKTNPFETLPPNDLTHVPWHKLRPRTLLRALTSLYQLETTDHPFTQGPEDHLIDAAFLQLMLKNQRDPLISEFKHARGRHLALSTYRINPATWLSEQLNARLRPHCPPNRFLSFARDFFAWINEDPFNTYRKDIAADFLEYLCRWRHSAGPVIDTSPDYRLTQSIINEYPDFLFLLPPHKDDSPTSA
jgi:hypothetical protein